MLPVSTPGSEHREASLLHAATYTAQLRTVNVGPLLQAEDNTMMNKLGNIRLEAFMVTELNKIFLHNKLCQLWIKAQRFRDHLRFHHQGNDVKVDFW
jgi:hypothetical protein